MPHDACLLHPLPTAIASNQKFCEFKRFMDSNTAMAKGASTMTELTFLGRVVEKYSPPVFEDEFDLTECVTWTGFSAYSKRPGLTHIALHDIVMGLPIIR